MSYIRVTVETATHRESSLLPTTSLSGDLLPEDEVIGRLQNLVVDLFYLATGSLADDILVLGDPWAGRNGNGVTGLKPTLDDVVHFVAFDPRKPADQVGDYDLCECGHPRDHHKDRVGLCYVCQCTGFLKREHPTPAPAVQDGDMCVCTHVRGAHWGGDGVCDAPYCGCMIFKPVYHPDAPDYDPRGDRCECGDLRGDHVKFTGVCKVLGCMCAEFRPSTAAKLAADAPDDEIPF